MFFFYILEQRTLAFKTAFLIETVDFSESSICS